MKHFGSALTFLSLAVALSGASSAYALTEQAELSSLQKQLFAQDFSSFAKQVQVGIPQFHTISQPSLPAYDPEATRTDWVNNFAAAIAKQSELSASDTAAFETAVQNLFLGYSNDQPYGKINFLDVAPSHVGKKSAGMPVQSIKKIEMLKEYPSPHTMDLSAYVNQRFAEPIQEFIQKFHVPFYGHDSTCADAIDYHRSRGFTSVEQYHSQVDGPQPPSFIAYNPKSRTYLFGVCDLIGSDDVTRMTEIVGPIFKSNRAFLVHHKNQEPIFTFNSTGSEFKFEPTDRVFIGYQNTVWWKLYNADAQAWQRTSLTLHGVETDLFYNQKNNQRIVSVANCYGDEMKLILEILYAKGARRFAYLGTSGGLDPSLQIGDVLIPTRFRIGHDSQIITFDNSASSMNIVLSSGAQVKKSTQQDWVPALVEESVANVSSMRDAGSQAMDVESRYIAEFFKDHDALEKTLVITVSDLPLGGETYVDAAAHRGSNIDSVNAILSLILENGNR